MSAAGKSTGNETPGPAPRFDAWKVIGPGGGGGQFLPTVSPHDPDVVVERCDMTGSYITHDGGLSWRMYNLRTVVRAFAFAPDDADVIYAGNAALWKSLDTGRTWSMVFPDPGKGTVEHMSSDHADYFVTSDDAAYPGPGHPVQAIAVDPADSSRAYVALGGSPASLYASTDGGETWSRSRSFGEENVLALYVAPPGSVSPGTVYAVAETGVYRGSGEDWEHFGGPPGEIPLAASIGSPGEGAEPLIYLTAPSSWAGSELAGGIFVSADGGRSWRAAAGVLTQEVHSPGEGMPPVFRAVACSSLHARTAYAGYQGLRLGDGEGPEALFNGIARTTDGGETWTVVHGESNAPSPKMEGTYIEGRALDSRPNIYFAPPIDLGVAPTDPDICFATDAFRTYKTSDGGETWRQVTSVEVGPDQWMSRGLDVTTCYGVHHDPFDEKHVFITYTDIGLFGSSDGGVSWTGSTVGIPNLWRNTTYWLVFDPDVKGLLWGAFGFNHDLPRPKMWRQRDPAEYRGGVAVSTDGGRHWELSNEGMPETAVTDILLDPESETGSRVLYACGFGRGVYRSEDNGRSWELRNDGLEGEQPFAWRITRAADGTLYLVAARRSDDGSIGSWQDGSLYASEDGAGSWRRISLPEGVNGPNGLAADPRDPKRLYLAAWGRWVPDDDESGGVFLSTDAGASWRQVFDLAQHVYDVTIDPRNPDTIYVCGFDSAAWRSDDGGESWQRIRGYNFKWGHRVACDPADSEMIYITTFGGSVWHGPAKGDPDAVEDVISPLDPWGPR